MGVQLSELISYKPPRYALRVASNVKTLYEYGYLHRLYPYDESLNQRDAELVETAVTYFEAGWKYIICAYPPDKQKLLPKEQKTCLLRTLDAITFYKTDWKNGDDDFYHKEIIPVAGRICNICNVFDKLTSSRSDHVVLSKEKAVELMKTKRGVQFDPLFLDLLERYIDKMIIETL